MEGPITRWLSRLKVTMNVQCSFGAGLPGMLRDSRVHCPPITALSAMQACYPPCSAGSTARRCTYLASQDCPFRQQLGPARQLEKEAEVPVLRALKCGREQRGDVVKWDDAGQSLEAKRPRASD